mmetsp:Transcript_37007/g.90676  ORF Transcript_37007/g.90676 Transcript_37007/m.90676 type:complete len:154 (-) Transcript_37007:6-467(-)
MRTSVTVRYELFDEVGLATAVTSQRHINPEVTDDETRHVVFDVALSSGEVTSASLDSAVAADTAFEFVGKTAAVTLKVSVLQLDAACVDGAGGSAAACLPISDSVCAERVVTQRNYDDTLVGSRAADAAAAPLRLQLLLLLLATLAAAAALHM